VCAVWGGKLGQGTAVPIGSETPGCSLRPISVSVRQLLATLPRMITCATIDSSGNSARICLGCSSR